MEYGVWRERYPPFMFIGRKVLFMAVYKKKTANFTSFNTSASQKIAEKDFRS